MNGFWPYPLMCRVGGVKVTLTLNGPCCYCARTPIRGVGFLNRHRGGTGCYPREVGSRRPRYRDPIRGPFHAGDGIEGGGNHRVSLCDHLGGTMDRTGSWTIGTEISGSSSEYSLLR